MRPEGVFASLHNLIGFLQTEKIALSQLAWPRSMLIPELLGAFGIEPETGLVLIKRDIQLAGHDPARSVLEQLADLYAKDQALSAAKSFYHHYLTALAASHGSRSFIAFSRRPAEADNLLQLPVTIQSEPREDNGPAPQGRAARVIDFQKWVVMKQTKVANKMTRQKIRRMTMREKRLRILDLISEDDMDHQTLANILEFLEAIAPETESQG